MDTKPTLKPRTKRRMPNKPTVKVFLHERHISPLATADTARAIVRTLARKGWRKVSYCPDYDKCFWSFNGQGQYQEFMDDVADAIAPLFAGEYPPIYLDEEDGEDEDEVEELLRLAKANA